MEAANVVCRETSGLRERLKGSTSGRERKRDQH